MCLGLCLAVIIASPTSHAVADDTSKVIPVVYDHWPPSTIDPLDDEPRRGFANELLRNIFTAAGDTVIFKVQPLNRGHVRTAVTN